MKSPSRNSNYISALRFNWLTSIYDPLIRWTIRGEKFKRKLLEQTNILPGHKVLDLGCGTATLTLKIKNACPEANVFGLDGDPNVLKIASAKAVKANIAIQLNQGMSFNLPYTDNKFDTVVSSLFFHHLTRENKLRTMAEIKRVLKPTGELHLVDWGKPKNFLMRAAFYLVQMLDGFETTADNVAGLLPELLRASTFKNVRVTNQMMTIVGTLSYYRAD